MCNVRIVNLIWKMREHLTTLFKSLFDPLASTFEMVPITSAPQFLAMSCFRSAVFRLDLWRNSGWLGPDILQFAFHTWAGRFSTQTRSQQQQILWNVQVICCGDQVGLFPAHRYQCRLLSLQTLHISIDVYSTTFSSREICVVLVFCIFASVAC